MTDGENIVDRERVSLSPREQAIRRPLPVGTLLSGIDTPILTNAEKPVSKRVIRVQDANQGI